MLNLKQFDHIKDSKYNIEYYYIISYDTGTEYVIYFPNSKNVRFFVRVIRLDDDGEPNLTCEFEATNLDIALLFVNHIENF